LRAAPELAGGVARRTATNRQQGRLQQRHCGACNVLMDGRLVNSCLVLGVETQGRTVTTVEGLATPQSASAAAEIPGKRRIAMRYLHAWLFVAAKALLDKHPKPSEEQVRHFLAGNLCRCTGYDKIVRLSLVRLEWLGVDACLKSIPSFVTCYCAKTFSSLQK